MQYDTRTEIRTAVDKIIVEKCPVCGEAMIAGGTCDICGYRDGPGPDIITGQEEHPL